MNTKTFAQKSRNLLLDGVAKKLLYWGFNAKGEVLETPSKIPGGYSFRGEVFNDPDVPALWQALRVAVQQKGIEVVVEEAAYTWFNRMMAIRVMAKNGYDQAQLDYAEGLEHTPLILQKARQGQFSFLNTTEQQRLKKIIGDYSKDQEAFALLLVGYCHSNTMLKTVFGKIDDYTELLLPDNMLQDSGFLHLLNTTDAISDEEYKKVELIGWLYQFYISERKDEVFKSFKKKKKAEAKDIPAATQIFTPNWIVKYMVENTAGKIWLDKHPNSPLKSQMKYLVTNTNDENKRHSELIEESLINNIEELTLIDPACGSGHILVEGFDLLYQMYMEEYYSPEEAVENILKKNLFGLDIDDRAAQLATFAILLKAATKYRDVFTKGWLPNVYAMPEAQDFSLQELKDFLGKDGQEYLEELDTALRLMKQAKNLGSVMKLVLSEDAKKYIQERYTKLGEDDYLDINIESILQGLKNYIPILLILTNKYAAVVANPPYINSGNLNGLVKSYIAKEYPISKSDLMTVFMEVLPNIAMKNGKFSFINISTWISLSTYQKLRLNIIENIQIDSCLHMGRGVFGVDFGSITMTCTNSTPFKDSFFFRLFEENFQMIDVNFIEKLFLKSNGRNDFKFNFKSYRMKDEIAKYNDIGQRLAYGNIDQTSFLKIPGNSLAYWIGKKYLDLFKRNSFKQYSTATGIICGDNDLFIKSWYEINFNFSSIKLKSPKWYPLNHGGKKVKWYGAHNDFIMYQNNGEKIRSVPNSMLRNEKFYFKRGLNWNRLNSSYMAARLTPENFIFEDSSPSGFFNNDNDLMKSLALLNSKVFDSILKIFRPGRKVEKGHIESVPFIFEISNESVLTENTAQNISISKKDWDSRETSWDFEQSPLLNETNSLERAYQVWQEGIIKDFFQLHTNEEELNRIFIDIYGLQDELTPEVPLKDITILQEELNKKDMEALEDDFRANGVNTIALPIDKGEVISQFISYAIGLFMGRYRLDKVGLSIAHPNPTAEELESYTYNKGKVVIDEDAILPLMGKNCNFPDDALQQFEQLLDTIWGHNTRTQNVNFVQDCLDKTIEKFLVKDFYKYHCSMYKKKPIYWLFASPKSAFQVLVYMHRMNAFTVEKIRANYLLEHIKNLRSEESVLKSNESNLSTQKAKRLDQIRKDIAECESYDLELKDVADQQIAFDLDDGVTVNYEKFKTVVAKIK